MDQSYKGGKMVKWLGQETWTSEVASSSAALTTYTVAGVVSWYSLQ